MNENSTPRENALRMVGLLDGTARIHRNNIAVSAISPAPLERIRTAYGGTIVGHRIIIRSARGRRRLLNDWLRHTRDRETDILRALHALSNPRDADGDAALGV